VLRLIKIVATSSSVSNMQRAAAVLCLLMAASPLQAAEPVRLRVIPYKAGWSNNKIPVHNFKGQLRAPPAVPPDPSRFASNSKKRSQSDDGNEWWLEDDSTWLMD